MSVKSFKTGLLLVTILSCLQLSAQQREKINLNSEWIVRSLKTNEILPESYPENFTKPEKEWYTGNMPKQVQEFILENNELPNPHGSDNAKKWIPVFEKQWVYAKRFTTPATSKNINICFDGLDTEVEIYLNGKQLSYCNNMFRRWKLPVIEHLKPVGSENLLVLKFIPPNEVMAGFEDKYPDTDVRSKKFLRKCGSDFSRYLGADPYFIKMGVFDDVYLEMLPENYINDVYIFSELNAEYSAAIINVNVNITKEKGYKYQYQIHSPTGELLENKTINATEQFQIKLDNPELWWPMNFGKQPLYAIKLKLLKDDQILDEYQVDFGIRDIIVVEKDEKTGENLFAFKINGKLIFMNGANWAPLEGFTHVWDNERANILLDLMKNGNMNFIRVWGEGSMPNEAFFEKCNQLGIVVWMEFMTAHPTNYPIFDEGFKTNIELEIEDEIKRFRNYSCIALWCSGNEHYLYQSSGGNGKPKAVGYQLFEEIMPSLVSKFDPQRFYQPSSPWGGANWPTENHPLQGDFHDYSTFRFQPLSSVPLFTTEVCMVSPYSFHNLKKFMHDDEIWPEGFQFRIDKPGKKAWPEGWEKNTIGSSWEKIGRIQDYLDISTAEDACRVFGTAHGEYIKDRYERQRRGVPDGMANTGRRSYGAAVWRLNDTWPMMYMSVVDYYLEPKIPYYFLKRACEPLLISFEQTNDEICVWLTNDTPETTTDSLIVELWTFDGKMKTRVAKEIEIHSGESKRSINLTNQFHEIWKRREFIVARYNNQTKTHLLWQEQFLSLKNAKINAEISRNQLKLWSDVFVKDVNLHLTETTGAVFSDNYFNLIPGEKKIIMILNKADGKQLEIKGLNATPLNLNIK